MAIETLTGLNKAAVLLLCLGEEATARVFAALTDEEVRQVTRIMAGITHVPDHIKEKVFQNYREEAIKFSGLFIKGEEFVRNAFEATGKDGKERAYALFEQFLSGTENRPLETISLMQPRMVSVLLEKEHPQTIALVLSTQNVQHASEILSNLPEDIRSDVIYRIAKIERVSPDVISRIEEALNLEIGLVGFKEQKTLGGVDKVVEIFDYLKKSDSSEILETISETDPDMAEEIRKKMFTFENLLSLDGRSLQMVLREVNNDSLTMALKTASEEMKEKIFANMSSRAADMIRDDLEAMGPVRLSEVELMQQTIVKIAMKLEEEGKLILGGGSGDELV